MTASMTGFAAYTSSLGAHSFAIELKSVNHRSLEMGFHLPDELRAVETPIRELLSQRLARGKVDCRISLRIVSGASPLIGLNDDVLERLAHWQAEVRRRVLRACVRRSLLDPSAAAEMGGWAHGGGFSVDASVRIEGADRAGLERLLRY